MKRFVINMIVKMCAKSILLAISIGVLIAIIGHFSKWNSPIAYSNAFFLAGCLLIVAGGMSRFAAGQEWNNFQLLSAESFRGMSSSDRANFIINASSSLGTLILGLLSGILLLLLSAVAAYVS